MKKLITLLLCTCMLLCTCATLATHAQEQTSTQQAQSTQTQATQSSEESSQEPATEHEIPPSYGVGKKVTEFVVVSDLHLGRGADASNNFVALLKEVKRVTPNTLGIIVTGDVVDSADDANYALFDQLYNSVPNAPRTYCVAGEHEYLAKGTYEYVSANHKANLDKFLKHISKMQGQTRYTPYYSAYLGGYQFIFLGADKYENGKAVYSDNQLNWLVSVLNNTAREKPVFVFMHQPLSDTVAGSQSNQGYDAVADSAKIKSIVDNYSNVVMFNGHSMRSLTESHTIYKFTGGAHAFNVGAISHLKANGENGEAEVKGSQGYYVTVYENAVLVRGRDFLAGEWIDQAYYLFRITPAQINPSTQAQTTKPATTTKSQKTTAAKTEAETEAGEEDELKNLIVPVGILAAMAVIVFIFVFRKPKEENNA